MSCWLHEASACALTFYTHVRRCGDAANNFGLIMPDYAFYSHHLDRAGRKGSGWQAALQRAGSLVPQAGGGCTGGCGPAGAPLSPPFPQAPRQSSFRRSTLATLPRKLASAKRRRPLATLPAPAEADGGPERAAREDA